MTANRFIILRRDANGYSSRGPVAQPMTIKAARDEVLRLSKLYPHQTFCILAEVGEAIRSERIVVKLEAPQLKAPKPVRVKTTDNVTQLRPHTKEAG